MEGSQVRWSDPRLSTCTWCEALLKIRYQGELQNNVRKVSSSADGKCRDMSRIYRFALDLLWFADGCSGFCGFLPGNESVDFRNRFENLLLPHLPVFSWLLVPNVCGNTWLCGIYAGVVWWNLILCSGLLICRSGKCSWDSSPLAMIRKWRSGRPDYATCYGEEEMNSPRRHAFCTVLFEPSASTQALRPLLTSYTLSTE